MATTRSPFAIQCFRFNEGDGRWGDEAVVQVGEVLAREACSGLPTKYILYFSAL